MPILPGTNSCGGSDEADTIFDKLVDDGDFDFPEIDLNGPQFDIPSATDNPLYGEVDKVSIAELTNRQIGGTGVFDALMDAMSVHLKDQFEKDRITGREYADVYTAALQGAMGQAVSFLMGKDQAYWQAIMTQAQARTAEIEAVRSRILLENTKLEYFTKKATAKTAAADYAVKKMQLALMDQDFCQKLLEKAALTLDVEEKQFRNTNIMPLQRDQLEEAINQVRAVITGIDWDNQTKKYSVENLLPAQKKMLDEQVEGARAQTLDTRTDGSTVTGLLGKQKALYDQQITSYKRDAEVKAARMFIDSWVTQKTIDEGLLAPTALQNDSINTIMERIKVENSLDT